MEKKFSKKIKIAIFILVGTAFFIIAIFVIGSKQNLFSSTIKIYSEFETVSGLLDGSKVRLNGINVGTVDDISIVSGNKTRVSMTIESKVKDFIKQDSKVKIVTEGLVGNKMIDITQGSDNAPSIADGSKLESIRPVEMEDIIKSMKETVDNASKISTSIGSMVASVDSGRGTLGQLITNKSMYNNVDSLMKEFTRSAGLANEVMKNISANVNIISADIIPMTEKFRVITEDIAGITTKMNSSESVVGTLLTDTNFANNLKSLIINADQTTANLENASFSLFQNMEALKHNFLFKGYFEDIGYWSKTDYEKNTSDLNMKLKIKQQELIEREKKIIELQKKIQELQQK